MLSVEIKIFFTVNHKNYNEKMFGILYKIDVIGERCEDLKISSSFFES